MSKLFACVAGMVALAAGIYGNVDAVLCLQRAAVAFVVGACIGAFWQTVTSIPVSLVPADSEESTLNESESQEQKAA